MRNILTVMCISAFIVMSAQQIMAEQPEDHEWSVFVYGGQWTDTRIGEILQFQTSRRTSYVWVGGASRRIGEITENLSLEVELNLGAHSGIQNHLELNSAAGLRWQSFPWDNYVNTSLLYGLGPSWAFRRPPIEQRSSRGPTHVLVFMPVEITLAPPARYKLPVETLLRIHHRSGAFGIVSDARGSNFITGGLRYRF